MLIDLGGGKLVRYNDWRSTTFAPSHMAYLAQQGSPSVDLYHNGYVSAISLASREIFTLALAQ